MKKYHSLGVVWNAIAILAITCTSYNFSADIRYNDIEPIISILQNTSAMVFTVMGIWIAYVYPNAVLTFIQPTKVVAIFSNEDLERVKMLVGIVILSAVILSALVVGVTLQPFIAKSAVFKESKNLFTGLGLWVLLLLTYAQLFCIYAVIASSVNFIIDLKNLEAKKKLSNKLDGDG